MKEEHPEADLDLFCARCAIHLHPGTGTHYEVRIEAFADPSPPVFDQEDLPEDPGAELGKLIQQLQDVSEREALDQVVRRLTLHLCVPCYRIWIENPTG